MASVTLEGTEYADFEVDFVEYGEVTYLMYLTDDSDPVEVTYYVDDVGSLPVAMAEAYSDWMRGAAMDAYADHATRRAESGYAQ